MDRRTTLEYIEHVGADNCHYTAHPRWPARVLDEIEARGETLTEDESEDRETIIAALERLGWYCDEDASEDTEN